MPAIRTQDVLLQRLFVPMDNLVEWILILKANQETACQKMWS